MPITAEWDDAEKTIILITISEPITWPMFHEGVEQAMALARTVSHRVDIISNPGSTPMPPGPAIPHLRTAFAAFPPNMVMNVAIITNSFARVMSSVAGQIYLGSRFRTVNSVEAARAIIYKERSLTEPK